MSAVGADGLWVDGLEGDPVSVSLWVGESSWVSEFVIKFVFCSCFWDVFSFGFRSRRRRRRRRGSSGGGVRRMQVDKIFIFCDVVNDCCGHVLRNGYGEGEKKKEISCEYELDLCLSSLMGGGGYSFFYYSTFAKFAKKGAFQKKRQTFPLDILVRKKES